MSVCFFQSRISFVFVAALLLIGACHTPETKTIPPPDPDNGGLILPEGFGAIVVADSLGMARHLAVNTNGDIYVKLRHITAAPGTVALRDTTNDGKADIVKQFGDYYNDGSFATEMRIHNGYLYFSTELVVYRQKIPEKDLTPRGAPEVLVIDRYPIRWHNAKSLAFDGKGNMYITFSAPTNVCEDWNSVDYNATQSSENIKGLNPCPQLVDQAGIWKFREDKQNQLQSHGERYATGLRSIVGISWNAADSSLYAVQHGRDYLSAHAPKIYTPWQNAVLPAEEFVRINEGDDFGWPYTYYDPFKKKRMLAPEYGGDGVKEANGYAEPLMGLPAHWAPNDLLFYHGDQFPERYKKGAFIAFHGSTNRAPYQQGGYIVAFVPFENGKPVGSWEVFADGFAGTDLITRMEDTKYRPMGLAEGPDGSLYIVESKKGKLWRVVFHGDVKTFGEVQLASMEKRKSLSHIRIPDEKNDMISNLDSITSAH